MMNVNAIVRPVIALDIGGVVIPYLDDIIDGYIQRTIGIDKSTFDTLWSRHAPNLVTGRVSEFEFWRTLESELGRPIPTAGELFMKQYAPNLRINTELLEILSSYKDRLDLVVFSNSIVPYSAYNRTMGIYDIFDRVFLSEEIGYMKPDPSFYDYTIRELDVKPDQIIFFDDRQANVDVARDAGLQAHRYTSNKALLRRLPSLNPRGI